MTGRWTAGQAAGRGGKTKSPGFEGLEAGALGVASVALGALAECGEPSGPFEDARLMASRWGDVALATSRCLT